MKKVLVYGLKSSGIAVIDALIDDYDIYIYDDNREQLEKINEYYCGIVKVIYNLENELDKIINEFSFVVISPAISIYKKEIKSMIDSGLEVIGELELGYKLGVKPLVSITGSNGKSTTVKLIEYIFIVSKKCARAVGNIGEPITKFFSLQQKNLINEVSSFQLETIKDYTSPISAILNITPNHLDRHKTFEEYKRTKLKLLNNASIKVLNYDDENLKNIKGYYFSIKEKVKGAYLDNKDGYLKLNVKRLIPLIHKSELKILGDHNIQNALASSLICYLLGIKLRYIKYGLRNFKGLKHRLNVVDKIDNITFINDSKSTSIDSCLTAVKSLKDDITLLLGGKDKNLDYVDMFKELSKIENIKNIIVYGEICQNLYNDYKKSNAHTNIYRCNRLQDSIEKAIQVTNKGIILLSPATSSFDEFECFEDRGNFFEKQVREYVNERKKQVKK